MNDQTSPLRISAAFAGAAGIVSLSVVLIGMVELFNERELIAGVFTMGQLILYAPMLIAGYLVIARFPELKWSRVLAIGFLTGALAAIPLVILVVVATNFDLRQFMPHVSPTIIEFLTFGQGVAIGSVILIITTGIAGLVGGAIHLVPDRFRRPLNTALALTLIVALLSEVLVERIRAFFGPEVVNILFDARALRLWTALVLFGFTFGVSYWRSQRESKLQERVEAMPERRQRRVRLISTIGVVIFFLLLPVLLGPYLSEVVDNVGLFVIMGLGLTIVVGYAGLLDLGYVAFFAFGAYTMAILTSNGPLGITGLGFWGALPIAILVAALAGILLGIPVLRMRGDYLAIVTLGFGEMIRILVISDWLSPFLGGAQGVLQIPKPVILGFSLIQPNHLYYVILVGAVIVGFILWRLSGSRTGRRWMSLREDEDVSEAMGIRLVNVKLLAFAFGAAFGGLAGGIFASKLTSIFPHSFSLLISINVLSLIILGGLGSLPGVVVGALVLVGLPELLRDFKEYRLLMYGAVLVGMMLLRPEGLWPSAVRKRELRAEGDVAAREGAGSGQYFPASELRDQ